MAVDDAHCIINEREYIQKYSLPLFGYQFLQLQRRATSRSIKHT